MQHLPLFSLRAERAFSIIWCTHHQQTLHPFHPPCGALKNMWAQPCSPASKQVLRKVPVVSVHNSNLLSESRPRKTPRPMRADVIQQNTPCKKRQTDPNWERQDNKQLLPHVKIRFSTNRTVATEDVLYHFKGTWERFGLTVTMKIFPWKKENQNLEKA